MSRALAFYFAMMGIYQAVGTSSDLSTGRVGVVLEVVGVVVWLVLAVGLYRRYRAARMVAILVCTVNACTGIILWFISGFQHHLLLLGAIVFGLPLVGLLHPRARSECVRSLRIFGRLPLTRNGNIGVRVNSESALGAGITAYVALFVAALVMSPSPVDQLVFVVASGLLCFGVLQIMFRLRSVKTSDRAVRRLLMAVTIFAILAFLSALYLLQYVIALKSEQ